MKNGTKNNVIPLYESHGCTQCYEVNRGYTDIDDGSRSCNVCGGKVLVGAQEAFDYIAHLHSQLDNEGLD